MERPRLLEQVRRACRARQFSPRTAKAYAGWTRRYVLFHGKRHPEELDGRAVAEFLGHLANERQASASTQRQASSALLFLYRDVLARPIDPPEGVARPTLPRRLPTVLNRVEISGVLAEMRGTPQLVAGLLYGAGLRLMEGLQIRLKDISFESNVISIRGGKGGHDRLTMVPQALKAQIRRQFERVR